MMIFDTYMDYNLPM